MESPKKTSPFYERGPKIYKVIDPGLGSFKKGQEPKEVQILERKSKPESLIFTGFVRDITPYKSTNGRRLKGMLLKQARLVIAPKPIGSCFCRGLKMPHNFGTDRFCKYHVNSKGYVR